MKFYFDCGLPRSGSTLLTALLNQNPNIHAGTLSPVFELMYYTDEILHKEQAQAFPKPKVFQEIVTNTLINYYSDITNPVVIDKCRAWPAHIDILKKYVTIFLNRDIYAYLLAFLIDKNQKLNWVTMIIV